MARLLARASINTRVPVYAFMSVIRCRLIM